MFLNVDGFWRCSNELFLAIFVDRLYPTKSSLTKISDNLLNSYFKFTLVLARSNRKFSPMIYHLQLSYGLVLVCFSFYHLIALCKLVIFLSLKCCQEPFKNEVNAKLAFYRPHSPLYFLLPSRPCYRYELHNKHKQPLKEQK